MSKFISIIAGAQVLVVLLGWLVCRTIFHAVSFGGEPHGFLLRYGYSLFVLPVVWFALQSYVASKPNLPSWLEPLLFGVGCVLGVVLFGLMLGRTMLSLLHALNSTGW